MDKRLDLLNRYEFVENVIKIVNQLSDIKRGCCFAIEGGWGIGKTFVIEEIEEQLKMLQSEETNSDRYFVFHYNCWQHDYYDEPAVAIISAMLASIKEDEALLSKDIDNTIKAGYGLAKEKIKEIAGLYIENKIGINLISLADEIKDNRDEMEGAENEFDVMFNFSQTIEKVRKKLREIAAERTIVLFVDELDRCIPQYAIKVLERLHHIFYGLDNVVVVMAIDRKQLEHSVEEMFGARKDELSIDVERYLKKFIDFSMVLDIGTMNSFFCTKYNFYYEKFYAVNRDIETLNEILPTLFEGIDARRQEKLIEKAVLVHSMVCRKKVDVSVLAFEMICEVLLLFECLNMKYIEYLYILNYDEEIGIESRIGKKRFYLLKDIENEGSFTLGNYKGKFLQANLCGRMLRYLSNIFSGIHYYTNDKWNETELETELVVTKKYYELCSIIK